LWEFSNSAVLFCELGLGQAEQHFAAVCTLLYYSVLFIIGRCEKLISPPIIMNHILKVGLGDTALSDLLEGKNTKDFRNI
jgi:hypothetical protein